MDHVTAFENEEVERQGHGLSVGVLVLNYNTWNIAFRALDAAIRLEGDRISEFVLFDDGSSIPPSPNMDPRIRLIRGGTNRGFARALKVAFSEMKSDVVVLFDSDAYPLSPFAARVRDWFQRDDRLGQLGFYAEDQGGSPTESFHGEPTKWSLLLGQGLYSRVSRHRAMPSNLCVFTCCMATRREAYDRIGGFDENFDWLDVDIDYSMRLRQNGWKVDTDPLLRAFHEGGGTPQLRRHRVLRYYKSRWYLLRKHGLITNVGMARALILTRLHAERAILRLFGRALFPDQEVLLDKTIGRRELLSYCREHLR